MRILFLDKSTKLETINDLKTRGRGGMVTSLFKVSDYLSMQGHDVTVFSDIENTGVTPWGTKWLDEFYGEYDCLITNRGVGDGYPQINAKHRVLWTHDLPHSGFIPDPKTMHAYDRVVFMSKYAEKVWRTFYRTIGKSVTIPNGVSKKLFKPGPYKDLNYLIFASAPNRGLSKLPFIFDCVTERIGRKLRMNAYSNMSVLHPNESAKDHNEVLDDGFALNYEGLGELNRLDPVPQSELACELGKASLMIMPTPFPEICSNAILQALACGTPVITTGNLGSAGEWVKHKKNGMMTEYLTNDYMIHVVEMIRNACYVLEDEKRHEKMIKRAARTRILSWDQVGKSWQRMIENL